MYLTGVDPRKSLNELYDGTSVDQVAAKAWAKETAVDSLQLCIEDAAEIAGQAQGGYNAAYTNTISWRTPTQPDRKSTRLNSSHVSESRMPSSA